MIEGKVSYQYTNEHTDHSYLLSKKLSESILSYKTTSGRYIVRALN